METREQMRIEDEISALRARSDQLLAQSDILREKSEAMAKSLAEAEAAARRKISSERA